MYVLDLALHTCTYARTREFVNTHTHVVFESLARGHKLFVSGTVTTHKHVLAPSNSQLQAHTHSTFCEV